MLFCRNRKMVSNRRPLQLPVILTWILTANAAFALEAAQAPKATPVATDSVSNPANSAAVSPAHQAPAARSQSIQQPPEAPTRAASTPGQPAVAAASAPATPAAAPAPVVPSRDNQAALIALQALNPSGWTSSPPKIFLPAIDAAAGAETASHSSKAPAASELQDTSQGAAASTAPQLLPFDQLTSEVDAQRVAILREFRCISVYSKNFKRGQREIFTRVYMFNSAESAYGAYSLLRQGATTVVRRGDGSSEDEQGISFWQGRTFVSVYGSSLEDDESKEVVKSIADKFSAVLKEHAGLPPILDALPKVERVKGSEHIVMGTLSARHFFPAPYLNYIDFSHAVEAATADYQIQTPPDRLKLLYIDFRYPGYAAAAYRTYVANFRGKEIPYDEPIQGTSCIYKANGTIILCQQLGGHLAIITGARKKGSATLLARYLH